MKTVHWQKVDDDDDDEETSSQHRCSGYELEVGPGDHEVDDDYEQDMANDGDERREPRRGQPHLNGPRVNCLVPQALPT